MATVHRALLVLLWSAGGLLSAAAQQPTSNIAEVVDEFVGANRILANQGVSPRGDQTSSAGARHEEPARIDGRAHAEVSEPVVWFRTSSFGRMVSARRFLCTFHPSAAPGRSAPLRMRRNGQAQAHQRGRLHHPLP